MTEIRLGYYVHLFVHSPDGDNQFLLTRWFKTYNRAMRYASKYNESDHDKSAYTHVRASDSIGMSPMGDADSFQEDLCPELEF